MAEWSTSPSLISQEPRFETCSQRALRHKAMFEAGMEETKTAEVKGIPPGTGLERLREKLPKRSEERRCSGIREAESFCFFSLFLPLSLNENKKLFSLNKKYLLWSSIWLQHCVWLSSKIFTCRYYKAITLKITPFCDRSRTEGYIKLD